MLSYSQKDSFCNLGEEELIVRLLGKLFASLQASSEPGDSHDSHNSHDSHDSHNADESQSAGQAIGVISLYAAQCWSLQRRIIDPKVQISTVDAFQGNEKDLIILSTVRSQSIGFSSDPKRLNVAITRAKGQLIIIGNQRLLESNALWRTILDYIQRNGEIRQGF